MKKIEFLAEANNNTDGITKGEFYTIEGIIRTNECGFGYAVLIKNDKLRLVAYDITHFNINFNYE